MPPTCDICGPDIAYEGHKLALPGQDGEPAGLRPTPPSRSTALSITRSVASTFASLSLQFAAAETVKLCGCPKPRHRHCINAAALAGLAEKRADWATCTICKQAFNCAPRLLTCAFCGLDGVDIWPASPHGPPPALIALLLPPSTPPATAATSSDACLPPLAWQQTQATVAGSFQQWDVAACGVMQRADPLALHRPRAPPAPPPPCAVDDRTKTFLHGAASQAPELNRVRTNIHELYKNSFELQASLHFAWWPVRAGAALLELAAGPPARVQHRRQRVDATCKD